MKHKGGNVIIIVGAPQTGKSFEINRLIKPLNNSSICAIDPYNDYPKGVLKFGLDNYDLMVKLALSTKNKTFIFEEATSYFHSNQRPKDMKKLLTGAMGHYGHTIFLVFHNRSDVPTWCYSSFNALYYTIDINKGRIEPPFDRIKKSYNWYYRADFF